MTNIINTNTIITVDDLRKLIRARNHLLKSIVYATAEEDVTTAVLTERAVKLHAMSKALEETFFKFYVDQGDRLNEHAAVDVIDGLLFDEIGMALALSNLVKQIKQEPESELSPEEIAEINAQEENPLIDISKLVVI